MVTVVERDGGRNKMLRREAKKEGGDRRIWKILYHQSFTDLCYFISAREHVVGWYHTGPKLNPNDLAVHKLIGKFCSNPVSSSRHTFRGRAL